MHKIKLRKKERKRQSHVNGNVIFEKPNHESLNNEGFMCIDMHNHSKFSDGQQSVSNIIKRCKKLGIGVSLTDHNEIQGCLNIYNKKTIPCILGIEVTASNKRDFLFYFYEKDEYVEFYTKYIQPYKRRDPNTATKLSMEKLLDAKDHYNCITVAAHPFGYVYRNLYKHLYKKFPEIEQEDIIKKIDGIEVINGEMTRSMNIKATKWSSAMGKIITGGSDAHMLAEVGKVVTAIKAKNTTEFLDKLKENQAKVIGKETRIKKTISAPLILKNHAKHYPTIFKDKTVGIFRKKPL